MVAAVDGQHHAEVELSRADRPVRSWRARCICGWIGTWRGGLDAAVAEYDGHLAENGIVVLDGAWWLRLPHLVPVHEIHPDRISAASACRVWAAEGIAQLDRLCRWARTPGIDPGR